ncbi:C6 finger domain protein [Aspergillus heteromorphus CBS 117.55]|uniref:C6 finger domain protein n=1 Tax=Aspergillus heteromorphus CBS 117.55 TaxID=1448321 RepID=A0A317VEW4_9EURO|nr:C6 finger domain protein [Aspergillus heteromorphus CBS 117.55]PWY70420.1 C6 finger domain protein [Aspergillus heteromorphus CBS 117.55]
MTVALSRPPTVDSRQSGPIDRNRGPLTTELVAVDDKQRQLPVNFGALSPMHPRMPHPDGSHGPPNAHGIYEQPWRPSFSSPYDSHPAEQRRTSNAPQPTLPPHGLPPHGYPVIPNRDLPQLPPDGPYGRQSSLPGPAHTPPEAPTPHQVFRPMNGTPNESPPHSAPPDYRPRMSFTPHESHSNGEPPLPPHTLPPSQYTTPVPHMSHTPTPYEPGYYASQAYGIRHRKAARAQQACDQCRARKAKCDEGRPACSHCKENSLICVYKEVPPHKQEKATQAVMDRLGLIEDGMNEKLSRILSLQVEQSNLLTQMSAESRLKEPKAIYNGEPEKHSISRLLKPDMAEILQKTEEKDEQVSQIVGQELERAEGEKLLLGEDGELSIPVDHTTAAHKLLAWPAIKSLLEPREYVEDYVMRLEEDRGLIRVYGRGEGDDASESKPINESRPMAYPTSHPSFDQAYKNDIPPNGTWGSGANQNGTRFQPRSDALDESGIFTTDPDDVRRYYQSYLNHIHKLHPFLNQGELQTSVDDFIEFYCPQKNPGPANILNSNSAIELPRATKRKRSCETLQGAGCDVPYSPGFRHERPVGRRIEKSLKNAVILLVLALGSICEIRGAVPGPVTDTPVDYRKQKIPGPSTRSILSPANGESIIESQGSLYSKSNSFSSPVDGRKGSLDRQSFLDNRHLRNVDVIPGLAYYAYASQILGSLQGANGLVHVQAALLAGLYAGQLAHPFQSHGWIYQAARGCQVLVRTRRYETMSDGPLKDLYDFAYWTCLQLESDILAELDLPASGISRSESRIALPKGRNLSLPNDVTAPSTVMMFFYCAQIHLRKVLNRVHTDLYKVESQGPPGRWSANVLEVLSMNLELWRSSLPDSMKWKDGDPPSNDINVARMRAKYYGARYIIHRPLLYIALHYGPSMSINSPAGSTVSGPKSQQVSPSLTHSQRATNMVRLSSEAGPASRSAQTPNPGWTAYAYRDLSPKIRRACKVCIDSAILSTIAFDGLNGRPVVTNIFGTAHAQFGNLLVLSAAYMSSLSELVDRAELDQLFKRTTRFLLQSAEISPSLRADARILSEIYEKIFGEPIKID